MTQRLCAAQARSPVKSTSHTDKAAMIPLLMVSLATFNIQGLGDEIKQSNIDRDCVRYGMDIICLQETKVTESYEHTFPTSGNKMFILDQFSGRHRGIGFVISKRMLPCVTEIKQISTNVGYVDFELQSRSGLPTKCRVVNAYSPHSRTTDVNPELRDDFFDELKCAITNVPSNHELFICGDFNARIGKLDLRKCDEI